MYENTYSNYYVKEYYSDTIVIYNDAVLADGLTVENTIASVLRYLASKHPAICCNLDVCALVTGIMRSRDNTVYLIINDSDDASQFSQFASWEPFQTYTKFLNSNGFQNARVYKQPRRENIAICLHPLKSAQEVWTLVSTIPVWLSCVNKDVGLNSEDLQFCKLFYNQKIDEAYEILRNKEFLNFIMDKMVFNRLERIAEHQYLAQKDKIEKSIGTYKNNLSDYEAQIVKLRKEIRELKLKLLGFEASENKEENSKRLKTEFRNLLEKNPTLRLMSVNEDEIRITYETVYRNWDQRMIEIMIDSYGSALYEQCAESLKSAFKVLWKKIFIDQSIKMHVGASFVIPVNDVMETVHKGSMIWFGANPAIIGNFVRNPNIMDYECFGSFNLPLQKAICDQDFARAIAICMTATQSITVDESMTAGKVYNAVYCNEKRFLELPDGRMVNGSEALEYIKETEGLNVT